MTAAAAGRSEGAVSESGTAGVPAGEICGGGARGSIRASIPLILARLRETEGVSPATKSNLLWLANSLLEYLARVADDRWANVTRSMIDRWCDGDWEDPKTGRRPGRSALSTKQRRWAMRRTVRAAVAAGQIPAASAIAGLAETAPQRRRRAAADNSDRGPIAVAIELWCPTDERARAATGLQAVAREWVTCAGPPSGSAAVTWLRIVIDALLWADGELGTAEADYVLHPRNVETFAMDPARGWADGRRAQVRTVLRRVGRAVCPGLWPEGPQPIGARDAAVPYSTVDEFLFCEAATMAGRQLRCERLWLTAATLGAGLRGVEAHALGPSQVVCLDAGRLGIRVLRDRPRIVPVRAAYSALVVEAIDLCGRDRFFESDSPAAASRLATRLAVQGLGRLDLHRARATFVCAHISAGTPLDVLDEIAGPVTGWYLHQMLRHCAGPGDPVEAANRGLAA